MSKIVKFPPKGKILFGENQQWAVGVDDGCLLFYPNIEDHPNEAATHIWGEAWDFIQSQGGFDIVRDKIRATYK
jgi:hypothetical protein